MGGGDGDRDVDEHEDLRAMRVQEPSAHALHMLLHPTEELERPQALTPWLHADAEVSWTRTRRDTRRKRRMERLVWRRIFVLAKGCLDR